VIDHITDLKKSPEGNTAVLRIVERLTSWPTLIAVPDLEISTVYRALTKHFDAGFRWPKRVAGDGAFKSLQDYFEKDKRKTRFIPVASLNPQSNWDVERPNREDKARLLKSLKNALVNEGESWESLLPTLQFLERNAPKRRNGGLSPAHLLLGQNLPDEEYSPDNLQSTNDSLASQIKLINYIKSVRADINDLALDINIVNNINIAAKVPPSSIEVGDVVVINDTHRNKPKLTIGTDFNTDQVFRVLAILGNNIARCASIFTELQVIAGNREQIFTKRNLDTSVRSYHLRRLRKIYISNIYKVFVDAKVGITRTGDVEVWGINLLTGKFVIRAPKASVSAKRIKTFCFREAEAHELSLIA